MYIATFSFGLLLIGAAILGAYYLAKYGIKYLNKLEEWYKNR